MNEFYFSEKDNLFDKVKEYISYANRELVIISPYITTKVLQNLIFDCKAKTTIITTWKLNDLKTGSSDLELYNYCKENNIYLYLNQRIHLKVIINDYSTCLFGSANISNKGLALIDNYNFELIRKVNNLSIESLIYFKKILGESILLNDEIYAKFKQKLKQFDFLPEIEELNIDLYKSEFLISSLPMSYDTNELFKLYSNGFESSSIEKRDCAIHDIILYEIPFGLNYDEFIDLLKERFFESEFIIKLLDFIAQEDRYFGRVKEWIQNNCEDVPVPSRRDLTGNIQVLYKWIVELSDGKYKVDRPNYSERIYRVK